MKRGALVVALFAAFIWLSSALAETNPPGRSLVRNVAVERALTIVQTSENGTPAQRAEAAHEALAALDGDSVLATNSWLREPLIADPPDLAQAATRLAATAALLTEPPSRRLEPAAARGALREVLADSRFRPRTLLSLLPGWLVPAALLVGAVVQFLWEIMLWPINQVLALLARLLGTFIQSPAFAPVVFVVIVLVIVSLVFLFQKALRASVVAQAEAALAPEARPPTATDALALAQQRANEGHYRDACHFVFLSSLLWVEEQTGLSLDQAATNREQLDRLSAAPTARATAFVAALAPVVRRFDRIWYGQAAIGDADYRDLLSLAARLREVTE